MKYSTITASSITELDNIINEMIKDDSVTIVGPMVPIVKPRKFDSSPKGAYSKIDCDIHYTQRIMKS